MIKLSELENDEKVIDEDGTIYDVEEIKNDLQCFSDKSKNLYATTKYHANIDANIDAKSMLESAIEYEYDNMYEDWDESIRTDTTEEDIEKIQTILDDIFSRNKEINIAYSQGQRIDIFN